MGEVYWYIFWNYLEPVAMSHEMSNQPSKDQKEAKENKVSAEDRVNPAEDLIYGGGYTKDPREIINNPAVAPQMPNGPGDLRGDLIEDE